VIGHSVGTDLRVTFREAVSSTWVICAADGGRPVGFTAISVVSVSVAPPLVSFNLSKTSSSRATIERTGRVSLHLLAAHQSHIARRFASDRCSRFVSDWHWHDDGLPALADFTARLTADVTATLDAGDSVLVTARVTDQQQGQGDPLVHHQGDYRSLNDTSSLVLQEESA
jgi:flavin reductase (DIM6/NTAB) family NADH-FMN oxidoreductase RutF